VIYGLTKLSQKSDAFKFRLFFTIGYMGFNPEPFQLQRSGLFLAAGRKRI
jgi:hypothetical protein